MKIFVPFVKKTIAVFNVFSIVASQSLFASQIVIDTTQTTNNPHLTHSQNNIDIVNIAKPSQAGISNNFYHDFNVAKEGAILNNTLSQEVFTNTQLAGLIYSNPNLDIATAKLILNQVTGANLSELLGYLEIAGSKADMLLANPNGITCQGCGFINAGNVSLATGTLSKEELERLNNLKDYTNHTALTLNIKKGEIIADALDAKNVASLTLLAKSMNVTDSLQAQNLRILLGSNQVTFSPLTLLYQPIILDNQEQNKALALDVAYLGSIFSNKIFIVATDKGVGIKNAGMIASTASQSNGDNGFILRADGTIEIARPIEVTTRTDILTAEANKTDSKALTI
ncbi:filamentous hemagglutinin N-terminal domain-containing protein [Helicobacter aurati]|uniref:Filamentous hemagglutinin N-terminal domain-containing protein n=1 Tax=Helicobacter aurati TaxID=137778 RepID=A0A3D8IV60_9HELI|nr:filamentous hemagglutinin N-terminal domain-containing protein [Helicobacter aurati]RDU69169.1 filamentous hemagglutinin N-terminal domain-containing protein [Helicobacter aurati]